ncbi:hypothetical protein Rhe02_55800 [Rhizocola hellebori]|uniref:Uncharacterized protein n=1 Tax=Rhizocola hellebori TaxID=1392758 RepID=A0A8J3VJ08_9ACTN|nr:hypothetical protein [Rhizocola hellebori]GIH07513.1 hypothetical protein Rhe02_55800 [Rhizocola hellebori]
MSEMQNRIAELAKTHGTRIAAQMAMSEAQSAITEREQEPGHQGASWDASEFLRLVHRH